MDESDVIKALAALAQPHRLRAFRALVVAGRSGLTPGALAERLQVPPNTLSFHLKELANAGLVGATREGRNLVYQADYTRMDALLGFMTAHCCAGSEPGPSASCPCVPSP